MVFSTDRFCSCFYQGGPTYSQIPRLLSCANSLESWIRSGGLDIFVKAWPFTLIKSVMRCSLSGG